MKLLLAFLLSLLLCGAAWADQIAKRGDDEVRLYDSACSIDKMATLILLRGDDPKNFLAARAHLGGKDYDACWLRLGDGSAGMIYEDGDLGIVPKADLKEVPAA